MWVDSREADLCKPERATQGGKVAYWLMLPTSVLRERIQVPLLGHARHAARKGRRSDGVQVNLARDGMFSFGVVTDTGEACAASRAAYEPQVDAVGLDFGLSTMFAASEGHLLGRNRLKALGRHDGLMTMVAASQQRRGCKPRDSRRYRGLVQDVRGFIRTEVSRVLNRLVAGRRPAALVLEDGRLSLTPSGEAEFARLDGTVGAFSRAVDGDADVKLRRDDLGPWDAAAAVVLVGSACLAFSPSPWPFSPSLKVAGTCAFLLAVASAGSGVLDLKRAPPGKEGACLARLLAELAAYALMS